MNAVKAVLRGNFIRMNAYIKKQRSQVNNLILQLVRLQIVVILQQTKPKVSKKKNIIKLRAEINEIETGKTIQKMNKIKSWIFGKIKLTNI